MIAQNRPWGLAPRPAFDSAAAVAAAAAAAVAAIAAAAAQQDDDEDDPQAAPAAKAAAVVAPHMKYLLVKDGEPVRRRVFPPPRPHSILCGRGKGVRGGLAGGSGTRPYGTGDGSPRQFADWRAMTGKANAECA